ncbi:MAG: leucine-rich repeat domain-containing protein, partial [Paludibacteraceae bacterium]|nr:leucine-rich repeat domain-containing protein [Paludibacteraceae bacterium]
SVTYIGHYAFLGCSGLTNIKIPSSVTSIGKNAFLGCHALRSIEIPSSVTSIGFKAFMGCENLEIVIDNSKENVIVEENTFEDCKSVKFLK